MTFDQIDTALVQSHLCRRMHIRHEDGQEILLFYLGPAEWPILSVIRFVCDVDGRCLSVECGDMVTPSKVYEGLTVPL